MRDQVLWSGGWLCRVWIVFLLVVVAGVLGSPRVAAHTPFMDANLSDWCLGAFSNTAAGGGRIEDASATLICGACSGLPANQACAMNSDCAAGQTCLNLTSKEELVWWDNRTDGAVNDLGTVAITFDNTFMYIAAELWVDPDPVSLPFGQLAIDVVPGGITHWHDPTGMLVEPGNCSVDTDRACTENADCHFCAISFEPFPSTRFRTCGSDGPAPVGDGICSLIPGDTCVATQTCQNMGVVLKQGVGLASDPPLAPDYLLVFDFSLWLVGAGDAVLLKGDVGGVWTNLATAAPAVNPGASGGSGGPPGSIEVAIPWTAFAVAPFGPGDDFRFTMLINRGNLSLDFVPDGAIEDLMSEPVAGATTTSTASCPGFGTGNTACEIADGSSDAFIPSAPATAGGRISGLVADKGAGGAVVLSWNTSCSLADIDYEVYEGTIGTWYSHLQIPGLCTTGGATAATVAAPGAGGRYYLVVPSDSVTEGSYGEASGNLERPASAAACLGQVLGNCPP